MRHREGPATLQGRVLLAVRYKPRTVSELAAALQEPLSTVLAAVMVLRAEDELQVTDQRRRGEVVLRLARPITPIEAEAAHAVQVIA